MGHFFQAYISTLLSAALLSVSVCSATPLQTIFDRSILGSEINEKSQYHGHISFAADNKATLYVNGIPKLSVSDWREFAYYPLSVNDGDVIGLKVTDGGVWFGAIAELFLNGIPYVTGRDDWVAQKAYNPNDLEWAKPSYSRSCEWRRPTILPKERQWIPGKATYFPDPTAARYVWAEDAGVHDTIFLRHRVGGEKCSFRGEIVFAADNAIEMFINGKSYGSVSDWRLTKTVTVNLRRGDVVAFRIEDMGVWYGAIAAFKAPFWHSTGDKNIDWRATKAFNIAGDINAWMYPSYSACRWRKPVLRNPGSIVPGKSQLFPYGETGAEYVWAANAGVGDSIFLRTVVGVQC